jgi:predicted esterase
MQVIDQAAANCFGSGQRYGLIGFSNGGNLVNRLYISSRPASVSWVLSIASEGTVPRAGVPRGVLIRVIAGRSDPTFAASAAFARQLAARGADVRFIEHDGRHELPFAQTLGAVTELAHAHSD